MNLFAQAAGTNSPFWSGAHGSAELWIKILLALLLGIGLIFALMKAPPRVRPIVVAAVTFLAGLYYVLLRFWPEPINRDPGELPLNAVEGVGFWLQDAGSTVTDFAQVLTSFLFGLGVYSLLRIHLRRFAKFQKDWIFSLALLLSMVLMIFFGYADYVAKRGPRGPELDDPANWGWVNYGRDFLFDGLLQQMDAAMFSLIAFFILSAAYRAFRIRSVEATILLGTALLVMLSLMGVVAYAWDGMVTRMADGNPLVENLKLTEISGWLRNTFQTASLRGIAFGVGIGALAMGLRLWLSLERGMGGSS